MISFPIEHFGHRRDVILKWMLVLLVLAGLNLGQANLLASLIATSFEPGVILSPCPSARAPHEEPRS
jgi:hypothetical protein